LLAKWWAKYRVLDLIYECQSMFEGGPWTITWTTKSLQKNNTGKKTVCGHNHFGYSAVLVHLCFSNPSTVRKFLPHDKQE
jgi:hypothetical protein